MNVTTQPRRYIEPRISVGNLITIAIVVGGIFSSWYQMDARISNAEQGLELYRSTSAASFERIEGDVKVLETNVDGMVSFAESFRSMKGDINALESDVDELRESSGDVRERLRAIEVIQQQNNDVLRQILDELKSGDTRH